MKYLTIVYGIIFTALVLCKVEEARGRKLVPIKDNTGKQTVELRSSYERLSLAHVQAMKNMSIRETTQVGFHGHSTIKHVYEPKIVNGNVVIVDHSTGLMWQQSGSRDYMKWDKAEGWVDELNSQSYAGYTDWRLPTIEEAATLLEPFKLRDDLYIGPVFDKAQYYIWTSDYGSFYGMNAAWGVGFDYGGVHWGSIKYDIGYVRPVRTDK